MLAVVDVPVVAGGGVADAAGVDAVVRGGAVAALCGTAYLLSDEAGTNALHRAALTDPAFEATALTRAYTGRWARGLANRFIAEHQDAPAAYPRRWRPVTRRSRTCGPARGTRWRDPDRLPRSPGH